MQSRLARSFTRGPPGVHWKRLQARDSAAAKTFSSFPSFLPPSQKQLIELEKSALTTLADILKVLDSNPAQVKLIQETRSRLDDIFLLVVVGEFNSGKSTFINALLGRKVLKEGVLPTTEKICVLRHQEVRASAASTALDDDYEEFFLEDSFLKNVALVDTPGTNGLIEKHAKLTEEVIPRSDLILFVTSAERPLSESETVLLSQICSWNRKVVVILNKMDITKEDDRGMLIDYVSQNVARVVGNIKIEPVRIFPVSGRQALEAVKGMSSDSVSGSRVQLLRNSNIEEVKSYLSEELSHQNIVREKLLNPLRMMDRIVETIASKLAHRQEMIEGDERTLEFVAENMAMWSTSLRQDALNYKQRVAHQQNQMRQRCSDFIAKDLSPLNIKAIVNASILSNSFRTDVLLEMETTLFDTKAEFRDLLAKSARQQQRSVMQYVGERTRQHQSKIMGSVNVFAGDEAAEQKHLSVIDRDINLLLSDFKPAREAEELTRPVSLSGVFGAASALGGAVGAGLCWLGMQDAMLASACAVAGVGGSSLFMWKRNSLKDDLDARLKEFSDRFDTIMSHHLINELERTQKRISDSIRPYETFVQLEKGKINDMQKSLEKVKKEINDIKSQI